MIFSSLSERMLSYQNQNNSKLLNQLPVIILCEGRNFKRLCKKLSQPYCEDLNQILAMAMFDAIKEMPGAVFGYQYSDKIIIVLENDQNSVPWLNNDRDEIISTTASLITNKKEKGLAFAQEELELTGDAVFRCKTFVLPKISEAVNYLIWQQNLAYKTAIDKSVKLFLNEKLGRTMAFSLKKKKKTSEKEAMLHKHCAFSVLDKFPKSFLYGTAVYKIPSLVDSDKGVIQKNKWKFNNSLSMFAEDKVFVSNILRNGHDIFRA